MLINNKQINKLFVGGPITEAINKEVFDEKLKLLFKNITSKIKEEGFVCFSAHEAENYGVNIPTSELIVKRDLKHLSESDFNLFLFPNISENVPFRTDGSFIELGYSLKFNHPTVICTESKDLKGHSPMLKGLNAVANNVRFITINDLINSENLSNLFEKLFQKEDEK